MRLILGELRTLNERLGGAEQSGPAVADGMTVTEQPTQTEESGVALPEPDYEMAHFGGGPHSCPDCVRSFSTKSGLSRHRRAKHEEG